MIQVKEIDSTRVLAFHQANFQFAHEPRCRHPEIVPYHDNALDPSPIALPQGLHQFRALFFFFSVQPLLELIKNNQYLLVDWNALSSA
jgi:hypothetical protein